MGDETRVQCLGQIHDAVLGQFKADLADTICPRILERMTVGCEINGKSMIIPSSIEVGFNWAHKSEGNVDGIRGWKQGTVYTRSNTGGFLGRVVS